VKRYSLVLIHALLEYQIHTPEISIDASIEQWAESVQVCVGGNASALAQDAATLDMTTLRGHA
jgi:hypothetical protein